MWVLTWTSFGSRTTGETTSVSVRLSEGALPPLELGRSSLRVAERERRDPRQVERLSRRRRNDRGESGRPRSCERTCQSFDDAEEQTREQEREQAERQLQ